MAKPTNVDDIKKLLKQLPTDRVIQTPLHGKLDERIGKLAEATVTIKTTKLTLGHLRDMKKLWPGVDPDRTMDFELQEKPTEVQKFKNALQKAEAGARFR